MVLLEAVNDVARGDVGAFCPTIAPKRVYVHEHFLSIPVV